MWQDIPDYLSDRMESVQKRALKIKYPNSSYSQALSLANETTLSNRLELLCHKFMAEMMDTRDHPLSYLVSNVVQRTNPYILDLLLLIILILDQSIILRELRDQRTFLLLSIRHLGIRPFK